MRVFLISSIFEERVLLRSVISHASPCFRSPVPVLGQVLAEYDSDEWGELEEDDDRVKGRW